MAEFETVPPFLLKSKMPPPAEIRRIQVVRYVTVAGVNEKRVQYLPQIVDEDEPEFACRVYFDFLDACVPAKLSCGTGTLKFATFSNLLQGAAAEKWQSALDEDGQPQASNAAFLRVIRIWISKSGGSAPSSGRGRGRGRSSGCTGGRGRSESHAIQAPPVAEQDDTVEEAPQEEEEHYHQEYEHPRRGQHWVDEHFGHYDNEYGYDEDYHVDEQYDY